MDREIERSGGEREENEKELLIIFILKFLTLN
jgi:hypothetical protein